MTSEAEERPASVIFGIIVTAVAACAFVVSAVLSPVFVPWLALSFVFFGLYFLTHNKAFLTAFIVLFVGSIYYWYEMTALTELLDSSK